VRSASVLVDDLSRAVADCTEKPTCHFVCRAAPPSNPGYRQCSVGKLRLLLSLFCTTSVLPTLLFILIFITLKKMEQLATV